MRLTESVFVRSVLFAAPVILSSTIAISPSRAASVASSTGVLVLENFNQTPIDLITDTNTAPTTTFALPGSGSEAEAIADARAFATPNGVSQFSTADANGSGPQYLAEANSSSGTLLTFNTDCGCFRFDFLAALEATAEVTNPLPGEVAKASSFVAFYIFNDTAGQVVDFFEASLTAGNPFNLVRSSSAIQFGSLPDPGDLTPVAFVGGSYARSFDANTALSVRGVTRTSAIATVPEPSMIAGLTILPGLLWLKRRKAKAVINDRQSD